MPLSSFRSPIVERTITALNQGSLDEFLAQFASDAEVVDVSTYKGHQAIRAWVQRENFNVHLHLQIEQEKQKLGRKASFRLVMAAYPQRPFRGRAGADLLLVGGQS